MFIGDKVPSSSSNQGDYQMLMRSPLPTRQHKPSFNSALELQMFFRE